MHHKDGPIGAIGLQPQDDGQRELFSDGHDRVGAGVDVGAGSLEDDAVGGAADLVGWAGPITCCKLMSWG